MRSRAISDVNHVVAKTILPRIVSKCKTTIDHIRHLLVRCDRFAVETFLQELTNQILKPVAHLLDTDFVDLRLILVVAGLLQDIFKRTQNGLSDDAVI